MLSKVLVCYVLFLEGKNTQQKIPDRKYYRIEQAIKKCNWKSCN